MKQLLFISLLVLLSCTRGNDYVSIRQIDSNHPITIGIAHDTIAYVDFPLAFQMNRLSPKTVTLLGHAYKCSSSLSSGYKGWDFNGIILFNVNGKVGYSPKGEKWWQIDRKQREYVVFIRYCFNTIRTIFDTCSLIFLWVVSILGISFIALSVTFELGMRPNFLSKASVICLLLRFSNLSLIFFPAPSTRSDTMWICSRAMSLCLKTM